MSGSTSAKNHYQLLLSLLLVLLYCPLSFAQVRVTAVKNAESVAGKKGIFYTLPLTVVHVDLDIVKDQFFPGPYATYAEDYLGIANVPKAEKTEYSISNVSISTTVEPDPGHIYFVEKEEKSDKQIWMSFSESGMVLGMENFPKSKSSENFENWGEVSFTDFSENGLFPYERKGGIVRKVDTIIRKVAIDTSTYEQMSFKVLYVKQTDEDKAAEAADKINSIRQDRYKLLVGYQETAYDKGGLEFMTKKLDEMQNEYLKLFLGTSKSESKHFSFKYVPVKGSENTEIKVSGFSVSSGLSAPGSNNIVLELKQQDTISNIRDDESGIVYSGFYYRIPAMVEARVSYQNKVLNRENLIVNQFGVIRSLPTSTTKVEFYPNTGAIRKVIIE